MKAWSTGSRWLRWDPHLHAPGTLRNDGYRGDWDGFLQAVEAAQPAPVALGITDYLTLEGYKRVLAYRSAGRLGGIRLVFPNVELRLTVETRKGNAVNLHLLISPEDPAHVERAEAMLSRLEFPFRGHRFRCERGDLVRLGKLHVGNDALDEQAALRAGANQFKATWSDLRDLRNTDAWFRDNVLFAVAGGEDGLDGLSKDSQWAAERENIGRFADIVFSAAPNHRKFWTGEHPDFAGTGLTTKPCLHGCDAHTVAGVLNPDMDRRCWVRAEPTFDGLKQTLVEPSRRVHIGPFPPPGPSAANVIRSVEIHGAPWLETSRVELNAGLVTIIGAKGSGKTALADLAAFGAHAEDEKPGEASFIGKARKHLGGVKVDVQWGDGSSTANSFSSATFSQEPRVRYLSQQFVERLCSNAGMAEALLEEIEAVVFSAIPEERRLRCSSFAELRGVELNDLLAVRVDERERIQHFTEEISASYREHSALDTLRAKHTEAERQRKAAEEALAKLPVAGDPETAAAHLAATNALVALRESIAAEERRRRTLADLKGALDRLQRGVDDEHERLRARYAELELSDVQWDELRLRRSAEAATTLEQLDDEISQRIKSLNEFGTQVPPGTVPNEAQGLTFLIAEESRLGKLLGTDQQNVKRRAKLNADLPKLREAEDAALKQVKHAEGAPARQKTATASRLDAYERLFTTLLQEQRKLEQLYAPLHGRLNETKLSFFVHRRVNIAVWASEGEELLDLRRPPFSGRGALYEAAQRELSAAWTAGTPEDVVAALGGFIEKHGREAMSARREGVTPVRFGDWLFSTDHISVEYGISYEGVSIPLLSPGTRGVVLLTLYLGLDRWDERPLIIDQPEENLDPKSVFSDLVPFFREAAERRQIIMVTHNANLVVNTDSDQVIVTSSVRSDAQALPTICYEAGGLEDRSVRDAVCGLLEGGEDAFRRRGRRYGMGH
ncbi:MAG: TrlF family AAA-like ATPase [Myxococcota bacterium]